MQNQIYDKLEEIIAADSDDLAAWSQNYYLHHRKRYDYDLKKIEEFKPAGAVLEVGSSPYHLTFLLKQLGYDINGLDINPERQRSFIDKAGLDIRKCNIETEAVPFNDQQFHYIIFNEIFEHLRINPIDTLRKLRGALHPDGVMVLSTPNLYRVRNVVNMIRGRGFDDPYDEFAKLEKIGHMGHVREYTPAQVRRFLNNTGFEVIRTELISHEPLRGMWRIFSPLTYFVPAFRDYQIHFCRPV